MYVIIITNTMYYCLLLMIVINNVIISKMCKYIKKCAIWYFIYTFSHFKRPSFQQTT